jgi:hypothetical protein
MKRRPLLLALGLLAMLAIPSFAWLGSEAHGDGQRDVLATVLAEWDKRRDRINVVRYHVTGETTIPAGSTLDPDTNMPCDPPKPAQDKKVKSKLMLLLDFANNRHRLESDCQEYHRYVPPNGDVHREVDASLFDGMSLMSRNYWDKTTLKPSGPPRADLAILKGYLGNYAGFNHYTFPLFLGHAIFGRGIAGGSDYLPGQLKSKVDAAPLSVQREAVLNGRACWVVKAQGLHGYCEVWADKEREGAILKLSQVINDKVADELQIDYQQTAKGWLPQSWKWSRFHYFLDGRLESFAQMNVDSLLLEPSVAKSDFSFTESPGMLVFEGVQVTPPEPHGQAKMTLQKWFRVDGTGKRREVARPSE